MFKSGDYVLAPLREYLNPLNAALVQPKLSPVTGACLYAMVLAGNSVDDQLVERLQAAEKGLA